MRPKPVMVCCYYAESKGRGKPEMSVDIGTARDMILTNRARWSKGCKYLELTRKRAEMYKTAPSLKPNIRTMDAFVEGKPHAIAIIEAWAWTHAA